MLAPHRRHRLKQWDQLGDDDKDAAPVVVHNLLPLEDRTVDAQGAFECVART